MMPARTPCDDVIDRYVEPAIPLTIGADETAITLQLRRVRRDGLPPARQAALLLHGGNSSGDTFVLPEGGFGKYLVNKGWEVWLLEWRGSPYVLRDYLAAPSRFRRVFDECLHFTMDTVASEDIPLAIEWLRQKKIGDMPLSILGHCLSGGTLSIAVARGALEASGVKNVVLSTLGLFYEVPWDGWVKVEDFVLERILSDDPACRGINPLAPEKWPAEMTLAYDVWPDAWRVPEKKRIDRILNRVAFMVGKPWTPARIGKLHGAMIERVFHALHLGLYLHCGQNVRRGYAAPFGVPDVIDRSRATTPRYTGVPEETHLLPEHFRNKRVTLVAAGENRVWHRDSIDLMYEWLRAEAAPVDGGFCAKRVVQGFNLQELFWATDAQKHSYPVLEAGLAGITSSV